MNMIEEPRAVSLASLSLAIVHSLLLFAQGSGPAVEPNKFTVLVAGSKTFSQARTFESPTAIARLRYRPVRAEERDKRQGWAVAEFDLVLGSRPLACEDGLGPRKFADLVSEDAVYVGFGTVVAYDPRRGVPKNSTVATVGELLLKFPMPSMFKLSQYPVWIAHPTLRKDGELTSMGRDYYFAVQQRNDQLYVQVVVRQKNVELSVDAPLTKCPIINELTPP